MNSARKDRSRSHARNIPVAAVRRRYLQSQAMSEQSVFVNPCLTMAMNSSVMHGMQNVWQSTRDMSLGTFADRDSNIPCKSLDNIL